MNWDTLKFGVEIEFIGGRPAEVELLPGWIMSLDEKQIDEQGEASGSELKPPPLEWKDREQIAVMLNKLHTQGTEANWSCGLHVHVGLEPWGEAIVLPFLDAALEVQDAVQALLGTSRHRLQYCPPITEKMKEGYLANPCGEALNRKGRPQSHRCGINLAAWYDIGTVEIRYANGSLRYHEIVQTIEFCLKFVAAVGAGRRLSNDPTRLAEELGVPMTGFPPATKAPRWYKERMQLEEMLVPVFMPQVVRLVPDGEILEILPVEDGMLVTVERPNQERSHYVFRPFETGWSLLRGEKKAGPEI